jgi:outer membrane receptor protein involved in Fe transport
MFRIHIQKASVMTVWAISVLVFALSPQTAVAQAESDDDEVVEELIVTGTRIKRTAEFDLPVPVQSLSSRDLEISGVNELSEALAELPAISAALTSETSQASTQSSGQSTISLRNLGSSRTLTLIDGRRTVGNTSTGSTISLDTVPDAFIERIEVITGGASAVYGSDAVTGVVNIITRDNFEGFQLETRYGSSDEGGNEEFSITATAGANFDDGKGNVIFSVEFDDEKAIYERQRAKAMVDQEVDVNTNDQPDVLERNSSSNMPGSLFSGNEGDALNPDGNSRVWWYANGGTGPLTEGFNRPDDEDNPLGPETISIPRDRILVAGKMHYDLSDTVQFFASAHYSAVYTKSERAPDTANSGRMDADFPIYLNDGVTPHPFMPQEIFDDAIELGDDSVFFRRRWIEHGTRFRESDNDTLRLWTGLTGSFAESWTWEANFGYGEWRRSQSRVGDVVIPNYQAAIDVEYVNPADTSLGLQCADDFARGAGCVPFNPFGLGMQTQDQVDWMILRDQLRAMNRTTTVGLWTTGNIYDLPAGPISVAAGFDYREEKSQTRWDPISTSGGGTVTQQVNQDGVQDVNEFFLEVIVPILSDVPGFQSLSVEGAVRSSDYSTVGSVTSYKYGLTWQPFDDIRLRASFAEANRAPNNIELFSRGLGSQGALNDPCDTVTATSTGVFDDTCRQDPIVSQIIASDGSFVNEFLQVQTPSVGNAALSEETADTYTVGLVFTPRFVEGLSLAIDYYDIDITNAIGDIDATDILQICYTSGDFANNPSCQIPERNSVTGQLDRVVETSLNINALRTSGLDFTARYTWEPNFMPGSLDFGLILTKVDTFEEEAPVPGTNDTFITDNAGLLGWPEYRSRFTANWYHDRWSVGLRTSYIGEMLNDDTQRNRSTACAANSNCHDKIALFLDGEFMHNLRVGYEMPDLFGSTDARFFAGINNFTDNQGPVLYALNQMVNGAGDVGENHHSIYDITGRYYYAGLQVQF